MRSELFALAHHRARDRDLKVKREKPIYRRYLEADELLDVLDAALAIDQRSSAETLELAQTVRQLREVERLPWKQIAARIGRAESTAIWLSRQRAGGRRGRRAAIATLALSGLRSQEVAGLRLRHLDFTHGRIVIEDGKTHGSVREVHMSPFLREELLLYVAELKLTGPDDLLFPTKRGTPRSRQNLNRRVLAPAVARAAAGAGRARRLGAAARDHAAHAAPHVRDAVGAGRPQRVVGPGADRARGHDHDAALLPAGLPLGDPATDQAPDRVPTR